MSIFAQILLSTLLISSISLGAATILSMFPRFLRRLTPYLVALSAGSMIGVSFLHLIPESVEHLSASAVFTTVLLSFFSFLVIERFFHLHHHHQELEHCNDHTFGWLNLLGDALHNFVDGIIIGSVFLLNPILGWLTTLAIITEEVPQELGDFGVLLFAGFSRRQALFFNFLVAICAVLGGMVAFFFGENFGFLINWLIPITAGGFLYIATVDLIPELYQHLRQRSFLLFFVFLLGIIMLPLTEKVTEPWLGEVHHHEEEIIIIPTDH